MAAQRISNAYREGWVNGCMKMKDVVIDHLHHMYTQDPKPERGSPEGDAILEVTRQLMDWFTTQQVPPAER